MDVLESLRAPWYVYVQSNWVTLDQRKPTGNDHDEDSDKEPEPPTKVVDKPAGRAGKRDAPDKPKDEPRGGTAGGERGGRGGRRGGFTGNDQGNIGASFLSFWMSNSQSR